MLISAGDSRPPLSLYYFILINDLRNSKKIPGSGKGFSSGFWDAVKVAIVEKII